jgi:autotransporter-associated beta strand protein
MFGFNPQTLAATQTWISTNLSTSSNWSNGNEPGTGDTALFNSTSATSGTFGGSISFGELEITNISGALTLGGDLLAETLTLNGVTTTGTDAAGASVSGTAIGIDMSNANNSVTLGSANDTIAVGAVNQDWLVGNGKTLTINGPLTGSSIITIAAGGGTAGTVTLGTSTDTFTGTITVNSGDTLNLNTTQSATATYILNNGATLAGTQSMSVGNFIYANSGSFTLGVFNGSSATDAALIAGNGNISFTGNGLSNVNWSSAGNALNFFGNYGGTVTFSSNQGVRLQNTTASGGNVYSTMANFNLGANGGSLSNDEASSMDDLGGLQGSSAADSLGLGNSGHGVKLVIGGANIASETFAGNIASSSAGTEFSKVGTGTLIMTGLDTAAATYDCTNGSYPLDGFSNEAFGGTLEFSYTAHTSLLASGGILGIAGGGTLEFLGNSGAVDADTQLDTIVGGLNGGNATYAGGGALIVNPNASTSTTFNMGALTASAAGATLDVVEVTGNGTPSVTTSTTVTNGILSAGNVVLTSTASSGGAATTTFAVGNGATTNISAYTGATTYTTGVGSATTNYKINDGGSVSSSAAFYTLQLTNDSTASPYTLSFGATAFTIAGALLFTGAYPETLSGGTSASNLIFQDYGSGAFTYANAITGSATVTVAGNGAGTVSLTAGASTTSTGATYINLGGTLSIAASNDLPSGNIYLSEGTLQATGGISTSRTVTLGGGGGTIDVTNGNSLTLTGVIGAQVTSGLINIYAAPLTKTDSGTLVLNQTSSTYLGATIINGGILSVSTLANGNSVSSIGESPATANALVLNGGTLQYGSTATSAAVTNRTFTVGPSGGTLDASGPTGDTVDFTSTSPVWYNTALNSGNNYNPSLTLTGANIGSNILAAAITDPSYVNSAYGGTTSLTKTGAGTWVLGGLNTYSGGTTVSAGILQEGTGNLGALGSSTGSLTVTSGTLDMNSNNTSVGAFSGNSTGWITSTSGNATLTINQGTNVTNTFSGVIKNGGSGAVSVNQATGTTILTGANLYTGATSVSGTLALGSGGSLAATPVTVNNGGSLWVENGNGGLTGSVTLSSGTLTQVDNAVNGTSLALTGGLTISGTAGLAYDINQTSSDSVTVTGALQGTGTADIFLSPTSASTAPTSGKTYTLLSDSSGFGSVTFALGSGAITVAGQSYLLNLSQSTSTAEIVQLIAGTLTYYWTGGTSATWSTIGNFATSHLGSQAQTTSLSGVDNVFLTADSSANYSQTLDGSYSINALTFTGTSSVATSGTTGAEGNTVTVAAGSGGGSNVLTITDSGSFTDANGTLYSGVGIEVQRGNAGATISANVGLGGSQAWEVDSANGLLVSGTISGGSGSTLTKSGTGTLTLSAANTYTGNTTVSAGTLVLSSGGSIGSAGVLTVSGSGTFDLAGNNQSVGGLSDGGVSTGTIISTGGAGTLTVSPSSTGTYSGKLTDNNGSGGSSLALAFLGTAAETLSGSNNYIGGTTVTSGTLIASNNYSLGSSTSTNVNAGLTLNPASGTAVADFTSLTPAIAALASTGAGLSSVVLGNATSGTSTALTVGGGGLTTVFNGNISDLKGTNAAATGSLTLIGGSLTLGGTDTYNGGTLLSGGTLIVNSTQALLNSTLTDNSGGGTLQFGSAVTATTFGGLAGSANIALTNASSGNVALSIGNNGSTGNTYSGALSGGGSLTILGGGTTLSTPETYTGTTTVNGGTTTITGGIGSSGTPAGNVTLNSGGTVNLQGSASIYTPALTINDGGDLFDSSTGVITDTGALDIDTNNGDAQGLLSITNGTVSASSALIGRDATNFSTTLPTAGNTTDGIYVNGGALNIAGTLGVGYANAAENSSVSMRMDSGSITVGGITTVTNDAGNRYSVLDLNGGTFNENDPTGVGILIGGNADTSLLAELLIRGTAIVNTSGITVGNSNETGGTLVFTDIGGTTNIGAGGISSGVPASTATVTVDIGSTSVATAPTLTATSSWSSSLNMTLANSSAGSGAVAPTFHTSTGNNIALTGTLGGSGGLTATGSGVLTLTAANGYSGLTSLNGGTLNINGEYALGGANYSGLTFGGGTLQYATAFSGNGSGDISQNSGATAEPVTFTSTATIDTNGNNVAYVSPIGNSGAGGLTVVDSAGTGSLTLDATETYTGATTINSGATLKLGDGTAGHDGNIASSTGIADNGNLVYNRSGANSTSLVITGTGNVSFSGTGSQTLTAASTYSGATNINTGATLQLGNGTTGHDGTINSTSGIADAGLLIFDRFGTLSSGVAISGTGNVTISGPGSQTLTAASTYSGATTINTGATLQLGNGTTGNDGTIEGSSGVADAGTLIFDRFGNVSSGVAISGTGNVTISGPGSQTLTAASTYSGATTINTGATLQLGNGTSGNDGTILDTTGILDNGTLIYNRFGNLASGVVISGTGNVAFSGPGSQTLVATNTYSGATTINTGATLQLGDGTTGHDGTILDTTGILDNGTLIYDRFGNLSSGLVISGTGNVTISGPGSQTFTAANSYTGSTSVGASSKLVLASGGSLGNTAVAVNGTLLADTGNGGISGSVTLNNGSTLSQQDGAIGSLNLGGLTISGSANLDYDISGSATDVITVTGGALGGSGNGVINFANLGGTAPADAQEYTVLSDSAGLGSDTFSLGTTALTIGGQAYTLSLANSTSTAEIVTLNDVTQNYYWTGGTSASWGTLGNFATNHLGTVPQSFALSNTSNVFLTADSAARYSQTLDGSYTVNSLSLTGTSAVAPGNTTGAASNPITLAAGTGGGSNVLTIAASSSFTDADGVNYSVGLEVQPGSAGGTISANIGLGSTQTWEIDGNALLVSGTISGGASGLIKSGTGTLILSAANTYAGGTTVSAGTLALQSGGSLLSTGALTVTGGTFDLAGNAQTVGSLTGSSPGVITSSVGAGTLTINDNAPAVFGGTITDNNSGNGSTLSLVFQGSSSETLSGANSYSGTTTVSSGTLIASNNHSLGSSTSASGGLTLNPSTGTAEVDFTSSSPSIAALASSGAGSSDVVLGNAGGSPTTLMLGGGGQTTVFGGVISDLTGSVPAAIGSLTLAGGSLTLTGVNTYTGGTTIDTGATLQLGNGTASNDGTIETSSPVVDNGTLIFDRFGNVSSGLSISGTGNVTISGPGSQILTAASTYSGATTINTGATLQLGNGSSDGTINSSSGVLDNGLLIFDPASSLSFSLAISGTGNVTVADPGSETLTTASTYSGATTIDAGAVLQLGDGSTGHDGTIEDSSGIADSGLLIFDRFGNVTSGVAISGTGDVTISGPGSQILTAANTYSGATTINAGATLQLGNGTSGHDGTIDNSSPITDSGLLIFDRFGNISSGAAISGTGSVTISGPGSQILTAANTYSGATTINAGATLQLGNGTTGNDGTIENSSPITDSGLLIFDRFGNISSGAAISGTGDVTISGPGSQILTAANTYSGATTINAGATLQLGNGTSGNDGTIESSSPVIDNGTLIFDRFGNISSGLSISGTGNVTVSGPGSQILTAASTYSGATTINTGATLQLGNGTSGNDGTIESSSPITDSGLLIFDRFGNVSSAAAISGTGDVTISGLGSQILTAANTYSGATTINSGATLQLGNGTTGHDGTIESSSPVIDNGLLIFDRFGNISSALVISGTGSVTISGPGTQILTAASTYSGATTINTGATLQLGDGTSGHDGTIESSSPLLNNGLLVFNRSGNVSSGVVISGTGNVTVSGTGSQTLTAASTYSGATTIHSGATLRLGNGTGGNDGSVDGSSGISDDGSLDFDDAGALSSGVVISGVGAVTVEGGGSETLTGHNTYQGATTIDTGATLQLGDGTSGNDGTIDSSSGITDNGTLIFDRFGSDSSSVAIGGSGDVTIAGGTQTLTAANTYDGATTIDTGATLQLGDGAAGNDGTVENSSGVTNNGTLIFNRYGNVSSGVAITGTGSVIKSGAGIQTLTADSSYTGPTSVTQGTLIVSGSVSGSVSSSVAGGARLEVDGAFNPSSTITVSGALSGIGSVGAVDSTGGDVAPGLSEQSADTGTLTASGDVSLDNASTLSFRLGLTSTTDTDQLDVTGGAALELHDSLLSIFVGGGANTPAALDQLYVIVSGGADSTDGSGSDSFFNAPYNGTNYVYTNPNGFVFNVFYGVNAANTATGSDVDVELAAIPEPGTWATLLGGLCILVAFQRRSRKNRPGQV